MAEAALGNVLQITGVHSTGIPASGRSLYPLVRFQFRERSSWFDLDADVVVLCESNRRSSLAMHVGEEYIDARKPHLK